ncbi:AMP-dependent synthetase/ligase [Natronoglycomyces albus]|uniref:Acyl-CoA synthetase n=1 Tax=Natronoglycomyces albus TaxID=2811108 RepID=A0A895XSJ6_9ACTN|nr:long-chain fatty acid--CoA ligase [Natronoglycomyces albus]QSB06299.1 long-chain fatty acid--CoA ligase [Natronoglycomyces albus]
MREFSVPSAATVADDENTLSALWENADNYPNSHVFARTEDDGQTWTDVTFTEFRDQVISVAKGLVASGVEPGDRVGLQSMTRYEWVLFDYAIWAAGGVTVPIYESSSANQAEWILSDSGAVAVIVENAEHSKAVDSVKKNLPELKNKWVIDQGAWETIAELGKDADVDIEQRRTSRGADDLATIIYTSGTTGRPKGCMLTHANLVSNVRNGLIQLDNLLHDKSTMLLFLPLAHVLARMVQVGAVSQRVKVGHLGNREKLKETMPVFQPTFLLAMPRVFEKVYNNARQTAADKGKEGIFDKAAQAAIDYSKALDTPGGPSLMQKVKAKVFDKLLYAKLRAAIGGKCEGAISGGAPLGPTLGHFFRGIGVNIYEGYGLTETSPVVSVNTQKALKIGSIGKPIPGTDVRVTDDGELQVRGPQVFPGYWNNDEATAKVIDSDGWFTTGDIAAIDDDGYLTITGRKKEIIVTSGGKNVAPAPLEKIIDASPLVANTLVVGDKRPFIGALISLDPEAVEAWLKRNERPADTPWTDLVEDSQLLEELSKVVDSANETVSKAEQIKQFAVLPAPLTEANGDITPSMKVKRDVVVEKYSKEIDSIYARKKA